MARSVSVTISAVAVFVASAFTLLVGAFAVLGSVLLSLNANRIATLPMNPIIIAAFEAVLFFGLGGWGIATGVGLVKTKEWARISMLVFSVLLLLFSLPATLVMAFVQFPTPNNPDLPANFSAVMRVSISVFYGALAALGAFWLYFFNKASVRSQFVTNQRGISPSPAYSPSVTAGLRPSTRPISITIIGWFLLVGSALGPFSLWYSQSIFHGTMPLCFLGFFLFGPAAILVFAAWMAAQIIAAVGLLKLKNWARLATIALQSLGILNVVLLIAIPANRSRFQAIMNSMMASMNARMPQPAPFTFPAWFGMAISIPVFLVILWFLVTRKQAFMSVSQDAIRPSDSLPRARY